MKMPMGPSKSDTSASNKVDEAPTKHYASFVVRVVRGWLPGATGRLQIAHDQSGERVQADSLNEAIDWIQSRSAPTTAPAEDVEGKYRERIEARSRDLNETAAA